MKKAIRRFGASALRHVAATGVALQVGQVTNWADASWQHQVLLALAGGIVGPIIRLLTDTADVIDPDH